jgi:hypothetical protein
MFDLSECVWLLYLVFEADAQTVKGCKQNDLRCGNKFGGALSGG